MSSVYVRKIRTGMLLLAVILLCFCGISAKANEGSRIFVTGMEEGKTFLIYRVDAGETTDSGQQTETSETAASELDDSMTETQSGAGSRFWDCLIDLEDSDADTLRNLANTLYGCVLRDNLAPDGEAVTNREGTASFTGLEAGWYLLMGDETITPVIVKIGLMSDVEVTPKIRESIQPADSTDETITLQVKKIWADEGYDDQRPDTLSIELYQDENLYETILLSAGEAWSYTWTDLPKDHIYQVVEKVVPDDYEMTISQENSLFTIKNVRKVLEDEKKQDENETSCVESDEQEKETETRSESRKKSKAKSKNEINSETQQETESKTVITAEKVTVQEKEKKLPQTGQLWWPVFVMAGVGAVMVVAGKKMK